MEPNKELEKAIANKFVTPQKFALDIEKIVVDEELNYIDAIIHYCEINNIAVESVTKLISKPLKERLKWDAIRLNFMKKTSRQNYLYNEKIRVDSLETSSDASWKFF